MNEADRRRMIRKKFCFVTLFSPQISPAFLRGQRCTGVRAVKVPGKKLQVTGLRSHRLRVSGFIENSRKLQNRLDIAEV